jgi:hypothetical protein
MFISKKKKKKINKLCNLSNKKDQIFNLKKRRRCLSINDKYF